MATNYSSWNNFDEEAELRTHEAKWHAENLAKNIVKSDEKLQASLSSTQASAASAASALQSKAAVEALKAQGISCGRRRVRPSGTQLTAELPSAAESSVSSENIIAISSRLSAMLLEIQSLCKFLQDKSPVYREAVKNLHRLFQLQHQVTELKTTVATQSPEMATTVLDGLQVSPLVGKTLAAVTLAALAEGRAAFAAEVARCSLKLCGDSLLMWSARGLAFAAMGNAYLCNVHLRQAKRTSPDLPLFVPAIALLDDLEVMYAHQIIKRSMEDSIVMELRASNNMPRVTFNLSLLMEEDYLVNTLRQLLLGNSNLQDLSHTATLHMAENDGEVSPRGGDCILKSTVAHMRTSFDASSFPLRINEVFYAAQVLFLENYFRSAEAKYWAVLALLDSISVLSKINMRTTELVYRHMIVCCLINIAYCQLETGRYKKQLHTCNGMDVLSLRQCDPIGLCKAALTIDSSLPVRLRFAYVLEKANRAFDAIEALQCCREELHLVHNNDVSCFADYGHNALFTQMFIGGDTPLPTLTAMSISEGSVRSSIDTYISGKLLKLENLAVSSQRGKLRSQSH